MTDQIISMVQAEDGYVETYGEKHRKLIRKCMEEIGCDESWRIHVHRYIRDRIDGIKKPIDCYRR